MGWLMKLLLGGSGIADYFSTNKFNKQLLQRYDESRDVWQGVSDQYTPGNMRDFMGTDRYSQMGYGRFAGLERQMPGLQDIYMDRAGGYGDIDVDTNIDLYGDFFDFEGMGFDRSGIDQLTTDLNKIFDTGGADASGAIARGMGALERGRGAIGKGLAGALPFIEELRGASIDPGSLFGMIDLPEEADMDARLASRLSGIGAGSRARERGMRQDAASRALAGGGLDAAGAAMDAIGFQESSQRGLLAGQAQADAEGQMQRFREFKGQLQGGLLGTEAGLNAQIAQTLASLGSDANLRTGEALGQLGMSEADLSGIDAQLIAALTTARAGQIGDTGRLGETLFSGREEFIGAQRGIQDALRVDQDTQRIGINEQEIGRQDRNRFWADLFGKNEATFAGLDYQNLENLALNRTQFSKSLQDISGQQWALGQNAAIASAGGQAQALQGYQPNQFMWQQPAFNFAGLLMAGQGQKEGSSFGALTFQYGETCLWQNTPILTKSGWKPLVDVRVGEKVKSAGGDWRRVVAKDVGRSVVGVKHYAITTPGGIVVVGTGCHVVNGKRIDQYSDKAPAPCGATGDLMLEGNADYVIYGGVAQSNIGKMGLSEWRSLVKRNPAKVAA